MRKIEASGSKSITDFEDFLEIVNLTKGWELSTFSTIYSEELYKLEDIFSGESQTEAHDQATFRVIRAIEKDSKFCQYIYGDVSLPKVDETSLLNDINVISAIHYYDQFCRDKAMLESILLRLERLRSHRTLPEGDSKRVIGYTNVEIVVRLNSIGQLEFENFYMKRFSGIDVRRIRICPICQNVFWAHRLNAKFCSKKCSNIHHQRIYQSDELKRAEYNERRKHTYKSKREQKLGKEKRNKNGTL